MQNQIVQRNHEKIFMDALITEVPRARRVIVLAPHPDDEVFSCAGLLSLLRQQGAEISLQIFTDGCRGGESSIGSLAATRMEESRRAAALLGLPAPVFWGIEDGRLAAEKDLAERLQDCLAKAKVDLVIAPALTELHPDHQALAFAVVAVAAAVAGEVRIAFYEMNTALSVPNLIVDISNVVDIKRAAMACFASQLQEQPYLERVLGLNRYRSYFLGSQARHAEAFFCVSASALAADPLALLEGPLSRAYREYKGPTTGLPPTAHVFELQAELDAIYRSRSWRITAPLRAFSSLLRTFRTRFP